MISLQKHHETSHMPDHTINYGYLYSHAVEMLCKQKVCRGDHGHITAFCSVTNTVSSLFKKFLKDKTHNIIKRWEKEVPAASWCPCFHPGSSDSVWRSLEEISFTPNSLQLLQVSSAARAHTRASWTTDGGERAQAGWGASRVRETTVKWRREDTSSLDLKMGLVSDLSCCVSYELISLYLTLSTKPTL